VATENVRNLQHEALQRAGLPGRQTVQRTGDLVQQVGGHLHIERGVLELRVAEEDLGTRMSTFFSRRYVAKLWRSVCMDTRLSVCAAPAAG
jgi:hypothetical protein